MNNYTELYHHGVLGQKWGVRRYQNTDGSLTSEGKKRYREDMYNHFLGQEKNDGFFARGRAKRKAAIATKIANQYSKNDTKIDKKKAKLENDIAMARANGDGKTANKLSKKWINQQYKQLYAKDAVKNIDKTTRDYMATCAAASASTFMFGLIAGVATGTAVSIAKAYDERDYRKSLKDQAQRDYNKKFR